MNHEYWYLSRAAGFTAYLLLFFSVAQGILLTARIGERVVRRNFWFELHRYVSILALAFSLFHVYILLGDHYLNFSVAQLSIPFAATHRPQALALGMLGLYGLIIVTASFYVRKYTGYQFWRTLHYITFLLFAMVWLHGIQAGSGGDGDTSTPWAILIYMLTGAIVLGLIWYRIQKVTPQPPPARVRRRAVR